MSPERNSLILQNKILDRKRGEVVAESMFGLSYCKHLLTKQAAPITLLGPGLSKLWNPSLDKYISSCITIFEEE